MAVRRRRLYLPATLRPAYAPEPTQWVRRLAAGVACAAIFRHARYTHLFRASVRIKVPTTRRGQARDVTVQHAERLKRAAHRPIRTIAKAVAVNKCTGLRVNRFGGHATTLSRPFLVQAAVRTRRRARDVAAVSKRTSDVRTGYGAGVVRSECITSMRPRVHSAGDDRIIDGGVRWLLCEPAAAMHEQQHGERSHSRSVRPRLRGFSQEPSRS